MVERRGVKAVKIDQSFGHKSRRMGTGKKAAKYKRDLKILFGQLATIVASLATFRPQTQSKQINALMVINNKKDDQCEVEAFCCKRSGDHHCNFQLLI